MLTSKYCKIALLKFDYDIGSRFDVQDRDLYYFNRWTITIDLGVPTYKWFYLGSIGSNFFPTTTGAPGRYLDNTLNSGN